MTSGATVYVTVVGAVVGSVVSGRVLASACTDHFMAERGVA
jgi:hypothetical protein